MEIVEWRWKAKDGYVSNSFPYNKRFNNHPLTRLLPAVKRDKLNQWGWRQEWRLTNGQLVIVRAKS